MLRETMLAFSISGRQTGNLPPFHLAVDENQNSRAASWLTISQRLVISWLVLQLAACGNLWRFASLCRMTSAFVSYLDFRFGIEKN